MGWSLRTIRFLNLLLYRNCSNQLSLLIQIFFESIYPICAYLANNNNQLIHNFVTYSDSNCTFIINNINLATSAMFFNFAALCKLLRTILFPDLHSTAFVSFYDVAHTKQFPSKWFQNIFIKTNITIDYFINKRSETLQIIYLLQQR